MSTTIALSGMDHATEAALRAAFTGANTVLGGRFELGEEASSEHVIVDMDSMYGPMHWLRLHATGKQVIGLTSAPRVQTRFRLGRPFDEQAMASLLREIAGEAPPVPQAAPVELRQTTQEITDTPDTPEPEAATPVAPPAPRQAAAPSPATSDPSLVSLAALAPLIAATDRIASGQPAPPQHSVDSPAPPARSLPATPPVERLLRPSPALPSTGAATLGGARPFGAWLSGALQGRFRYRRETGPTLLLDFINQQYYGPSTLKPLHQYFDGPIEREAFERLDDATWSRETREAGAPHALVRLVWLGGLLAGDGTLADGYDPEARYQLNRWPQTEREYPRHFRIATAMMKSPATLPEIIAGSGLPAEEVYRFVNANLATGYAEMLTDSAEPPELEDRQGGFLSRLGLR